MPAGRPSSCGSSTWWSTSSTCCGASSASHVAQVLRRLRRLCAVYGSDPTFVFTSATIGSPEQLARTCAGSTSRAVLDDGSPRGERLVALWNPPRSSAATSRATTRSAVRTPAVHQPRAAGLTAELIGSGHHTICFCRSRKGTELVAGETRHRLPDDLADSVRAYRGGYLAAERREIEAELFSGRLRGVVATTALELGIDVGGLDAASSPGSPEPSHRCGNRRGGPAGRGSSAWPCWWRETTSSTSG